jgi:chromosome segregation ATPase
MVTEALADVPPMRDEVVTIRKQSESLDELLPALESMKTELAGRLDSMQKAMGALEGIEDDLDHTVKQLLVRMDAMHETVLSLQDDVQRITDRLPDPDDAGPLERARDALTGGGRG